MSELTCSAKLAKALLFISTLLIALAGLALFGCGIWFVSAPSSVNLLNVIHDDSFHQLVRASGGILIGIGLLLIVLGVAGCWGSLAQKTSCLTCFQAILIFFIIMQIIATVLAGVFHSQISNGLTHAMDEAITKDNGYGNNSLITGAWDFMQNELECCGIKNYSDWSTSWWKVHDLQPNRSVPDSCCKGSANKTYVDECNAEASSTSTTYELLNAEGCEAKFEDWFHSYWGVLIGIVVAVIVIELAGIVLSCCVVSGTRKAYEYV